MNIYICCTVVHSNSIWLHSIQWCSIHFPLSHGSMCKMHLCYHNPATRVQVAWCTDVCCGRFSLQMHSYGVFLKFESINRTGLLRYSDATWDTVNNPQVSEKCCIWASQHLSLCVVPQIPALMAPSTSTTTSSDTKDAGMGRQGQAAS